MSQAQQIKVQVNGEAQDVAPELNISGLLESLGLADKPVVLELNERALFPREYANTTLSAGDRIEIVQITAGG